jgi:plasmid stabilization system protein ParE
VPGYKLSRNALREVAEIVGYLHRESGSSVADKIERRLFAAFSDLAQGRALGHRRSELTARDVLFYFTDPYLVVFRKTRQTTYVVHVVHGSRDLKQLLK